MHKSVTYSSLLIRPLTTKTRNRVIEKSDTDLANFGIRCFNYQIRNLIILENVLELSCEEQTDNPKSAIEKLLKFATKLGQLDDEKFGEVFHGDKAYIYSDAILNMHAEKISKLSKERIWIFDCGGREAQSIFDNKRFSPVNSKISRPTLSKEIPE